MSTTDQVKRMFESNADKMRKKCEKEGHYGIRSGYYDGADDSGEAIRETRHRLYEAVGVSSGDRVLDVGCGFGDCLLWLAAQHGATGVGIDIAQPQVETARELATERGLTDRVEFRRGDYHDLSRLQANSFDLVWALESLMHTNESTAVVREFTDVLRPGGRVVVCDPFRAETLDSTAQSLLEDFEHGNHARLDSLSTFRSTMRGNGFVDVEQQDITVNVVPGISKRAKVARWLLRPVARAGAAVGLVDSTTIDSLSALIAAGKLFRDQQLRYNIVTARYDGD